MIKTYSLAKKNKRFFSLKVLFFPRAAFYALYVALLFPTMSLAAIGGSINRKDSLGAISDDLLGIGFSVQKILHAICIIAGSGLILGSLIQYKKYRQNPIETKLSSVFFTFLLGVCVIAIAFIPMQTDVV